MANTSPRRCGRRKRLGWPDCCSAWLCKASFTAKVIRSTGGPRKAAQTAAMTQNPTDPLLAKWVHLYDQLEAARAALKTTPEGPAAAELRDEVERLKRL